MNPKCDAEMVIDFDSIWCRLEPGHDGPHQDLGESAIPFRWMTETDYQAALTEMGV